VADLSAQALTEDALAQRLHALGISPRQGRSTALLTLAAEVPAAILAKTLGIHVQAAIQWQKISAGDWAAYAADVSSRSGPQPVPSRHVTKCRIRHSPRTSAVRLGGQLRRSVGPPLLADRLPDQRDAVSQRAGWHLGQLEPQVPVYLVVEPLEGERVLEADLPGCGGLHEALVADEEDHGLVDPRRDHPADFSVKHA
jgi:hypothetical protein